MYSQNSEEFRMEIQEERKRERRKKKASQPVFKKYEQEQMTFLPSSLEELIEEKHLVRILNETVDGLNLEPLIKSYKGGGTSSYHPLMQIKILLYAYLNKIYSSRQISKALRENIHFMWLSGGNQPDFRTINNFRLRLTNILEEVFASLTIFLSEHGYLDLEKYFIDGTKLRADAKKTSYLWKKNTERYHAAVKQRIHELLKEIEEINKEEEQEYGQKDLPELGNEPVSREEIVNHANKINERLSGEVKKKSERLIKRIEKELPKLEKYEDQESKYEGRNSYSLTDPGATFFRHKNNELLPSYSVQIGTENQYIINFSIHQSATDSVLLISHLEKYNRLYGNYPKLLSSDSGYGSQENYKYLEEKGIENYLKYNTFHYETTKKYTENKYHKDHFIYNADEDTYQCPAGRKLKQKEEKKTKTKTGYEQSILIYESENCRRCRHRKKCKKGTGKRTIQINRELDRYRQQARENLMTEKGIGLRKQRNVDVEPVFGDIKHNQGYQRLRLRGTKKVEIEVGLLSMAHNIKKLALAKI